MHRKNIIITGTSRGIGRAISVHLLQEGYYIHGFSRSCTIVDPNYQHTSLDLSDLKSLPERLQMICSQTTSLNALICNAGRGLFGHLEELSFSQIHSLVELNFLSQVYLVKTFLPLFKRQRYGDIILIGSESALTGKKEGSIYCATKFALRGFAQALRDECRRNNIRVTLIHPGLVKSDFFENLDFSPGEDSLEHILPEDIALLIHSILNMRAGTVIEEITLSPQKNKVLFK